MWITWALYVLVVIFNILDTYQTWLLLQVGAEEANPMLQILIDQFGFFWGVGGAKALVVGGLGVFIAVQGRKSLTM